jgi:tRNA pseudouridine32 synthase/23S rRNA pseudouridine746 synthase
MHNPRHAFVLPLRDGVGPSCVVLPSQGQGSMLDFLAQRLPGVQRSEWLQRMQAGDVVDERGVAVLPHRPFEGGIRLYYYRHLQAEPALPFAETVLYQDEHLLVADKPHFMPVTPSGRYLQQTLLVRLKRRLGLPELSPLHRIDRDTAGLVLFSVQQRTRGAYQALFRDRQITKHYDAVAPWHADVHFPRDHRSRLEESPQFFRMHEVPGEPNSHTHMQVCRWLACGRCTACRPSPASATSCACTWRRWGCRCATTRSTRWSTTRPRATIRGRCSCWRGRWSLWTRLPQSPGCLRASKD